jgi:uncharacterized protein
MSTYPEPAPQAPEEPSSGRPEDSRSTDPLAPENIPAPPGEWTGEPEESQIPPDRATSEVFRPQPTAGEENPTPLFVSYSQAPSLREERIPHAGHLGLLILLGAFGWLGSQMLLLLALQFHLWGVTPSQATITDYHYIFANEAAQYIITFAGCLLVFPLVWRRPFFAGVHWNGRIALERTRRLIGAAVVCFFVAMINGVLMPGPVNAPIDELFRAPGAAWVLFAFGVTLAPFFEEMAFRGFLLPSLCTAWDWSIEHFTGAPRRPVDQDANPQWSILAMIVASVVTSVPFALMHGAQTSWSLGPFLLLIFVSLVLCWVRLSTRSLAASTMVHAFYNFMLFTFMLLGTGGFKHLDKM